MRRTLRTQFALRVLEQQYVSVLLLLLLLCIAKILRTADVHYRVGRFSYPLVAPAQVDRFAFSRSRGRLFLYLFRTAVRPFILRFHAVQQCSHKKS